MTRLTLRECRADVFEEQGCVVLEVDLPGVRAKDVFLKVDSYVVSIRAAVQQQEQHCYHRRERGVEGFVREIALPVQVSRNSMKAELRDGVLTVRLNRALELGGPTSWRLTPESDEVVLHGKSDAQA